MARQSSQDRARINRRRAAAEAAHRARVRRRWWTGAGAAVALLAVLVFVVTRSSDSKPSAATGSAASTTAPGASSTAGGSAAGKPCVALADPLPAGAPDVPIQTGPPPTSLVVQDLKPGTGAEVAATSTLSVQYIGVSCSTGKIFDSSWSRGQPASFPLAQVIPGWQQGLTGMKVGGERLLGIPPDLGYGATGQPPAIAPDESLWFVVDVLDAK